MDNEEQKKNLRSGDPCPGCLVTSIVAGSSIPKDDIGVRVQYYSCSQKCGWTGKQIVPLDDAPRQNNPKKKKFIQGSR